MKIRNGFVSNSSSSSFMIGMGVVTDQKKLEKYLTDNKIVLDDKKNYSCELKIATVSELRDKATEKWSGFSIDKDTDILELMAPINNYHAVMLGLKKLQEDDKILYLYVGNDEGDGAFYTSDNGWGDLDYDQVDINWFSENQQLAWYAFNKDNGVTGSCVDLGANRNG